MTSDTLEADTIKIIRDVVLGEMRRFGGTDLDIVVGTDHDGDLSLQIDVHYSGAGDAVDTKVVANLLFKLRQRLWESGETRFPYIRHHFPDNQKVVGFR
jgi:hypothetical protein